jgi:nucleotide-binding universal stress UspA family protein
MYKTILVPLDGSERAERILPHVEELALKFGARLVFLQVVEPSSIGVTSGEAGTMYVLGLIDERTKEAQRYLTALQARYAEKKLEARIDVEYGPIARAILDVAAKENADLIALASHGRSGLARVFYGSVASAILQRADRPLLLIRAQE